MKEEALRLKELLLNQIPEIKEKDKIRWKEVGTRMNFKLLCIFLKENAIPTKTLNLMGNKHY